MHLQTLPVSRYLVPFGFVLFFVVSIMIKSIFYTDPRFVQNKLQSQFDPRWIKTLHDTPCHGLGYSQGNQDCMLDVIFHYLQVTNKFFVEFGFNDPQQCAGSGPNTCKLFKDGWRGLLLDGTHQNPKINLHAHFLYANNIVSIFNNHGVPLELDYLSCDMDSHDFFVLSSILSGFKPRVVTTEYNCNWPIGWYMSQIDPSLLPNQNLGSFKFKGCIWGASVSSLHELMRHHGYSLIGVTPRLDLFWARSELLIDFHVPSFDYFIQSMEVGTFGHFAQTDHTYHDWLIDTRVFLRTRNVTTAQNAARTKIRHMLQSPKPLPCFSQLA